jgi:uncharacterized protein
MATTNVEQDNVASVRRGFEAFTNRDMATLTELFHPDAKWRTAPTGVLRGDRSGRDDVFAMFAQLGQETQGSFSVRPLGFAASGDQVFVHATATGQRNGKTLNADEVLIFTLADGKVRDVQLFMHDYAGSADFWQ